MHWQKEKERRIEEALDSDPVDLSTLRELAVSLGGLVSQQLRKKAWPKLVGVNVFHIPEYKGPPLTSHKERPQVLLDVNRCGKRIPPGELQALMLDFVQGLGQECRNSILCILIMELFLFYICNSNLLYWTFALVITSACMMSVYIYMYIYLLYGSKRVLSKSSNSVLSVYSTESVLLI